VFVPLTDPPCAPDEPSLVIAVDERGVALLDTDAPDGGLFLGTLSGRHCWAVDATVGAHAAGGRDEAIAFQDLRNLWGAVDEVLWTLAGRAVQLVEWTRTHRFCGRCGEPTEAVPGERARRCRACGLSAFPRLAPAVITLIERDDGKALLARGVAFPLPMFSCIAGFVEPGETIEDAVHREIREEVGVEVRDLRYFGSQPWPFPHSLMIGFHARYAAGDVVIDEREIAEAGWFGVDELPMIPSAISIARKLIDDWIGRQDRR
jgi:NAD+ diphosphatase